MKNTLARLLINLVFRSLILCVLAGCSSEPVATITFEAFVGGQPLEFGKSYPSPNGSGTYMISDFKFYISNLKLIPDDSSGGYAEEHSYHLVKFESHNLYTLTLDCVSVASFDRLSLSIGIDEEANLSTHINGDLNPTDQMAWNWTSGYKFLLLEGMYLPDSSGRKIPLVYHIGFSENRKDLEFEIPASHKIRFAIEINELFKNPTVIDFNTHSEILFNVSLAAMMAENYGNGFITIES